MTTQMEQLETMKHRNTQKHSKNSDY